MTPGLITIVSPRLDIGRLGAEKLLDAIAARSSQGKRVGVGSELVVRGSTRGTPASAASPALQPGRRLQAVAPVQPAARPRGGLRGLGRLPIT